MLRRLALCLVFALGGCGGGNLIVVDGIEIYAHYWQQALDHVSPLAEYQLQCQAVTYRLMRRTGRSATQVSAEGCGKRALFIRPQARAGNVRAMGDWRLEGAVQDVN